MCSRYPPVMISLRSFSYVHQHQPSRWMSSYCFSYWEPDNAMSFADKKLIHTEVDAADVSHGLIHYDLTKEVRYKWVWNIYEKWYWKDFKDVMIIAFIWQMRWVHELVSWLDGCEEIELSTEELCLGWCKIGPKKQTLQEESHFCHPDVLKRLLDHKVMDCTFGGCIPVSFLGHNLYIKYGLHWIVRVQYVE